MKKLHNQESPFLDSFLVEVLPCLGVLDHPLDPSSGTSSSPAGSGLVLTGSSKTFVTRHFLEVKKFGKDTFSGAYTHCLYSSFGRIIGRIVDS